jgi:hypothetical protein
MVGGPPLEACQGQMCCKEADLRLSFTSADVCQPGVSFPLKRYICKFSLQTCFKNWRANSEESFQHSMILSWAYRRS